MRRHPRVVVGTVAAVVLVVVVALLGGFARRDPDRVRVVAPGTEVAATPFRVRLDRAEASYERDGRVADEGLAYVLVEGRISLDDDESVGSAVLRELFGADLTSTYDVFGSQSDEAEPTVEVAADGSTLLGVGPGLTYDVRLVYLLDESAVPDTVTVTFRDHDERPSSLDKQVQWYVGGDAARVRLDVSPLPDERPDDEDAL